MKKKYTAKTAIALNIVLDNGKSAHIAFSPLTGGSSVYYTDDGAIQKGLERHYKFGKLFKVVEVVETPEPEEAEEETQGPTIVKVSDADAAKDYLSERYGLSRTKLKSIVAINKAAAENGIEFDWSND